MSPSPLKSSKTPPSSNSQARPTLPLGGRLRAQRKALGWSLEDASRRCSVQVDYIRALETHDLDALPTVGYGLGYVRAYARVLGLDAEQSVADFKRDSEVPRDLGRPSLPHFVPTRRIRLPRGSVPALGVLGAVVMLGVWYGVQLDTVAAPSPTQIVTPDASSVEPAAPTPDTVLTLRTTAPSWVTIRDPRGRMIINRVFVTGETWQTDVGQGYTVDVRDSGAVELLIGDTSRGTLGNPGEPLRGLDLATVR